MEITPLDIRKQEFKKSFNGYDKHEVDSFLEMVAEQMESLVRENMAFQENSHEIEKQIDYYRKMEKTLQDTLTSAQRTTDDFRSNAAKEAEIILKNAALESDNIIQTAKKDVLTVKSDIKTLITMKNNFIARFRGLIEAYMKILDQEMNEHKLEMNEFNQVIKEPPENVMNLGALFNQFKKEEENYGEDKKHSGILRE